MQNLQEDFKASNTPTPRMGREMVKLVRETVIHYFGASERSFEVKVMARVEGYAMVSRKGCMPFIVLEADLLEIGV